ncbi:MAG: GIY-YIG nuclease family protein [Candidatus Contendobacter sp.]
MEPVASDSRPGTYVLVLRVPVACDAAVGRRDRLALQPGWMLYTGSALGPGGVEARLAHHRRLAVRPHWHIDSLRRHTVLEAVWFSYHPKRRECRWAMVLAEIGGLPPPFRFGASDCRCRSHLYRFQHRPLLAAFTAALHTQEPDAAPVMEQLHEFQAV